MMYRQQNFFFAILAALAMTNFYDNGMGVANAMDIDMGNITFYNETDDDAVSIDFINATEEVMDIDCACDIAGISCTDPADEEACVCEDGDVVCEDIMTPPVDAPEAMEEDEPLPPDTEMVEESGSVSVGSMVSLVLSAASVAAVVV